MRVSNTVVVVTGASSGIGRATALAFAGKGATVVVAARRAGTLDDVVRDCEARGGRALAVPTDMTDAAAARELARRAVAHFGRIDVWVNAAAVSLFGPFQEVPLEDFRRVLEVNAMGYVHGARAALPYLRGQGHGVLVNVSSVVSEAPQPYTTAYIMSKAAVSALSASLRQELRLAGERDVKVCTVLPASIDTPLFQQAANYTGRRVMAMPPVYSAERVARAIVAVVRRPRAEKVAGPSGLAARLLARTGPRLLERVMARQVDRAHLSSPADRSRIERVPVTAGNIHAPSAEPGSVAGGWHGKRRTAVRRAATAAALGAAAAAVTARRRAQGR